MSDDESHPADGSGDTSESDVTSGDEGAAPYDPEAVRRLLADVLGPELDPESLRLEIEKYKADLGEDDDEDDEELEEDARPAAASPVADQPFKAPVAQQSPASTNGANGAPPGEDDPPVVIYDFRGYAHPSDHPAFDDLRRFVHWLVWHFELGENVPECWAQHDAIVEELAAIFESRRDIWAATAKTHSPLDQTIWLGYLDSALARIEKRWDRNQCGGSGKHTPNVERSVWAGMAGPEPDEEPI